MPKIYYDYIDKEFVEDLLKTSLKYKSRWKEIANSRIELFAASIFRQLNEYGNEFDLITSAGNSGLFMVEITKLVYNTLGISMPQTLILPIYRFKNDGTLNSNVHLVKNIRSSLTRIDIKKVLFVDDEIMRGTSVKIISDLLDEVGVTDKKITIVAENQFFEWHHRINGNINYFAYSRLLAGFNNNIAHFVDTSVYERLKEGLSVENYNEAMAILLTGKIKRLKDDKGYFEDISDILQYKITEYKNLKESIINDINILVKRGIERYKSHEIEFPF